LELRNPRTPASEPRFLNAPAIASFVSNGSLAASPMIARMA